MHEAEHVREGRRSKKIASGWACFSDPKCGNPELQKEMWRMQRVGRKLIS